MAKDPHLTIIILQLQPIHITNEPSTLESNKITASN